MKIIIHDLDEKELEKIYNLTGINKNENIILIFLLTLLLNFHDDNFFPYKSSFYTILILIRLYNKILTV